MHLLITPIKSQLLKLCIITISLLLPYNQLFSATQDTVTVQLKWSHQFQFAGFYAAFENGYYEEAGLKVNIIEGGVDINHIDEVVGNNAQFGVESPKLLLARNNIKPVVVFKFMIVS